MELRELISFYHVARLRSVSKAARRLELGQPTVTTHLRKLEEEFSITLFDRIKRPIQLTSDGAAFLELVSPIVQAVDVLKTQMDYSEGRGAFVVGAYPDLVMHHLPRAIQPFRARYPDVRIRLIARSYVPLIQLVKAGEVDLAVCSPPPSDDPSLDFKGLFQSNVVLITPPEHVLLQTHPVQLQDIAQYPLILSGPESLTRHKVEQALKSHGLSWEVVLAVDSTESIKRYVEIGMGVAITSDFTLHPEDHHKLGVVRLDHIFPSSFIGVCTLKGKFLGRSVRNFIDTMNDEMQGFHAEVWDWSNGQDNLAALAGVAPEPVSP
jgi:LysR family cys regulon transcriptional activator